MFYQLLRFLRFFSHLYNICGIINEITITVQINTQIIKIRFNILFDKQSKNKK